MDSSKRRFLSAVTAGAALIPIAGIGTATAGTVIRNNNQADRKGQVGKRYAMVVDLRKCVGCQACTVGCSIENQAPIGQFRTTVKQYEVTLDDGSSVTQEVKSFMLPRLCNHCDNPPCVAVCPVQATYQREDGIVMVDNSRCVACAYCVQACPYDARFINQETLTADKCTFCAHRLEEGLLPACVETCVGGARVIGDLNNPSSEVNRLLNVYRDDIKVLKPNEETKPHVFYIGMNERFTNHIEGQAAIYDLQGESV
ncbi:sulfate reduction electron transfer complex DsrMKJOP subunit DsrO [Vibrio cholerae]|uniref:sulfate reduction electron transfer complex DsrMKJOP subunit DsrO n=1 Tax=Vibrio cholerae TaxID=666 RepID=UPI0015CF3CC1|nr:4Fe-4S dicluster domain-containing protein [Vibrio cholerae]EGR0793192.1 4Fe-4S dicluster domain-containing protein [Vibrio cholerae]EGR0805245.1 4Fe-4S dicluster domain-containing protein [Vibrio cholerae]EGR0811449.1 4Fe-4S dicluster domain-containing protein [Vibrio cholerae]EGR0874614.1 4Fe-4S dicluster domain-containing protein [Vibrio cholerae]EJE4211618.1 4Fe-4S dicluster domain-containing protein [Vibrio cholerae]